MTAVPTEQLTAGYPSEQLTAGYPSEQLTAGCPSEQIHILINKMHKIYIR